MRGALSKTRTELEEQRTKVTALTSALEHFIKKDEQRVPINITCCRVLARLVACLLPFACAGREASTLSDFFPLFLQFKFCSVISLSAISLLLKSLISSVIERHFPQAQRESQVNFAPAPSKLALSIPDRKESKGTDKDAHKDSALKPTTPRASARDTVNQPAKVQLLLNISYHNLYFTI